MLLPPAQLFSLLGISFDEKSDVKDVSGKIELPNKASANSPFVIVSPSNTRAG